MRLSEDKRVFVMSEDGSDFRLLTMGWREEAEERETGLVEYHSICPLVSATSHQFNPRFDVFQTIAGGILGG